MSEERIVSYTREEIDAMLRRGEGRTDWARLDAMRDEDIDTSDIPDLDASFWENARMVLPTAVAARTVTLDDDISAWFHHQGDDWRAKVNAVLRDYCHTHTGETPPHTHRQG